MKRLILYTDRHSTYFTLEVSGHQVCLAHLLRNLQYLCDINKQQQWAGSVQELLRDAIHTWNESKCGVPGTEVRKSFGTQAGADQYACFHSILETAKRNGGSKFGTLYQLMIEDNPDSSFIETITS